MTSIATDDFTIIECLTLDVTGSMPYTASITRTEVGDWTMFVYLGIRLGTKEVTYCIWAHWSSRPFPINTRCQFAPVGFSTNAFTAFECCRCTFTIITCGPLYCANLFFCI